MISDQLRRAVDHATGLERKEPGWSGRILTVRLQIQSRDHATPSDGVIVRAYFAARSASELEARAEVLVSWNDIAGTDLVAVIDQVVGNARLGLKPLASVM